MKACCQFQPAHGCHANVVRHDIEHSKAQCHGAGGIWSICPGVLCSTENGGLGWGGTPDATSAWGDT